MAKIIDGDNEGVPQEAATRLVVATRAPDGETFFSSTQTGQSLAAIGLKDIGLTLHTANARGLPEIYNETIDELGEEDVNIVFLHDDVYLLDYFWAGSIARGLSAFDIIGVAGNTRRLPRQPTWYLATESQWDHFDNLSGIVGHGSGFPPTDLSVYGDAPREVVLLDGVLLAVSARTLRNHSLRFDERFAFHFYDLDFCREAEMRGLRMGTWPLSIVHGSGGKPGSEDWRQAYDAYLEKWGE